MNNQLISENIFNTGKTILSKTTIGYDEKRINETQPYYNILAGFIEYFNISNVNSDVNDGFNLNHDHQIQEASSFNVKDPNMGMAAMTADLEVAIDSLEGIIIFEEGDQKIIMVTDENNSDE